MAFVYTNSSTFNVESVLRANILDSDYYNKTCLEMSTWEEVVDEIYECVEDVEPWMSGNARGPSTAFNLLYRLFTLKLNTKQVKDTINHHDSPYIRAIGFLFLRYVADPKTLLAWVSPFLADKEEFAPSPGGGKVTMGDFVRDIILEQYYFETIFPRIPKPVMDNIIEELKRRGLPYKPKGNAGQGGPDRRGVDDGNKRPPSVKASLSVAFGQRAPNRAGAREDRYASAISHTGKSNTGAAPGPSTAHERVRERSPSNVYGSSRGGRDDRDRDRGRDSRDRDRDRDRDRERDRGGRDYRDRDADRARDYHRDYERDRVRDRDRDRDRDKDKDRERSSSRRRSRSRSPRRSHRDERDGDRGGGRDARDVFRERASGREDLSQAVRATYGDASGKLFDDRDRRRGDEALKGRNEEVYRVGGGRR